MSYTKGEREKLQRVADGLEFASASLRMRRAAEDRAFAVRLLRDVAEVTAQLAAVFELGEASE